MNPYGIQGDRVQLLVKNLRKFYFALLVLFVCEMLLALSGLVFRCIYYFGLPVHPGDAYGIADLIEFYLGVGAVLAGILFVVFALGMMVATGARRKLLAAAALVGLIMPLTIFSIQKNTYKISFCRR